METEGKIVEMRRILTDELPDDNYFILKYVVHFLTEVFMFSCGQLAVSFL